MMSALEGQVTNLEESMYGVNETLKVVEGRTDELNSMRVQLRDYMAEALGANLDVLKEALNTTMVDQTEKFN
ncbi:hypothetical protein J1N35_043032 [Gossypium stocksii]|uniref:Uncharacterized protein n=1 Tax=Gossypium stocksii TaxID=47602 RepID=A0A9D3U6M5_9ROSI|nr:hypothetical protein J1N35_043032 [Gossypium stocksii]